ncbi:hypothetical protein N657DRAFT_679348 [Parathielavia appendiculata]|uniref:Uncharacterized protein n=1 Tax=Parathielavia appendiculata TaxID=2587402 RepID=A0AAN6U4P0_9PEZI|nr:hypothetical protein N657DRAFT_679348 [Parathielavia appendiculata]
MDINTYPTPTFFSPALLSDLLQFIINRCSYPTTLIICADRAEFLSSLIQDLIQQQRPYQSDLQLQQHTTEDSHDTIAVPTYQKPDRNKNSPDTRPPAAAHPPNGPQPEPQQPQHSPPQHHPTPGKPHPLLTPHLSQLSTTRHIRTIFVPTVSHLRAFLSLFPDSSSSAKTPPHPRPPPPLTQRQQRTAPLLVVFSFLALHRHTSEWSAQGLGASAALLVEAGRRAGLGVVLVESASPSSNSTSRLGMADVLGERVPVLSGGSAKRAGGESGWTGMTVNVGRLLRRWFRFRDGEWHGYVGGGG